MMNGFVQEVVRQLSILGSCFDEGNENKIFNRNLHCFYFSVSMSLLYQYLLCGDGDSVLGTPHASFETCE